jgi:hypothetical protein
MSRFSPARCYKQAMGRWGRGLRWSALALAFAAGPALAFAGSRAAEALAKLEQGRWLVRSASQAEIQRSVCLGDPALLFQIEHGEKGCSQQLVHSDERGGTVEYVCPGRGFGRTSVRIETGKVAMIDTQGFVDGRPFAYRAIARKLSGC